LSLAACNRAWEEALSSRGLAQRPHPNKPPPFRQPVQVAIKRLHALDTDDDGSGSGASTATASTAAAPSAVQSFFDREIAILASIRHPNVVNFIGACHRPPARCLVTEYCARGSLDRLLHGPAGAGLGLVKRVEFAVDVARGMACLHAQQPMVIHRDLKTANLLVSARFEVKVADFGLSRIKDATHVSLALFACFGGGFAFGSVRRCLGVES
jgi:serine/threonine protein kinase